MSWWSSVVDGVKSIGTKISDGIKWAWNNISLSKIALNTVTYTTNTAFHVLEQGLALRKAVPTLVNNRGAQQIAYGMGYIVVKMAPILALNYGVNWADNYFRDGHETDEWSDPYSLFFLGGLSVVNYLVVGYTFRQGTQMITQVSVLNAVAPSAFNSNKMLSPPVVPNGSKPTLAQQTKGVFQEPLILAANDVGTYAISCLPGGRFVAPWMRVCFNGRYVTRSVTPERSVGNKEIQSESALALGLTYEASIMLMDYLLESSVGMPPFLYYKTLKYLVLLLHINVAAHMDLPLAKESTLLFDPFNAYERASRFFIDVIFAGLKKRVPIDFKPEKGVLPLIPLSPLLKCGTRLLNSSLESEKHTDPGMLVNTLSAARRWLAPPIFQPNGFNTDPIMSMYWPGFHEGFLSVVTIILSFKESKTKTALHWVPPSGIAQILNLKFGIPKGVIKFLIRLSKKDDFWEFLEALELFLLRNKVQNIIEVVQSMDLALHGEKAPVLLPPHAVIDATPVERSNQLITTRLRTPDDKQHTDLVLPASNSASSSDSSSQLLPVIGADDFIAAQQRTDVNPARIAASFFGASVLVANGGSDLLSTRHQNSHSEVSQGSDLVSTRQRDHHPVVSQSTDLLSTRQREDFSGTHQPAYFM